MKNLIAILPLLIAGLLCFPVMSQQVSADGVLVVIDGDIASNEALNKIPNEEIKSMHYLSSEKARNIYGPAGANGALLVQTRAQPDLPPIVLEGGRRVPADSLAGLSFRRIDVIRGEQALRLYGPTAKNGIFVLQPGADKVNVLVEVVNEKGRPVPDATIKNEEGITMAVTNKCGQAYLEGLPVDHTIGIFHKKYQTKNRAIAREKVKIVLEK